MEEVNADPKVGLDHIWLLHTNKMDNVPENQFEKSQCIMKRVSGKWISELAASLRIPGFMHDSLSLCGINSVRQDFMEPQLTLQNVLTSGAHV